MKSQNAFAWGIILCVAAMAFVVAVMSWCSLRGYAEPSFIDLVRP